MPLARYPDLLEEEYGLYFRVARAFAHVIGQPALMQQLTRVGMQSQTLMEWVLRIMANLLRPDELGPAEAAYKAVAAIAARRPRARPGVRASLGPPRATSSADGFAAAEPRRASRFGVEGDVAVGGGGPRRPISSGGMPQRRRRRPRRRRPAGRCRRGSRSS